MMRCPKCGSLLQAQQIGEVEVDQCTSCHGIWLDLGELPLLLDRPAVPRGNGRVAPVIWDTVSGSCPRCGGEGHMTRITSLKRPDVVMDSCPVCYGIWLDGGELSKLAAQSLRTSIKHVIRSLLEG
jgi:Zn-finger nucleic acid-binding protein